MLFSTIGLKGEGRDFYSGEIFRDGDFVAETRTEAGGFDFEVVANDFEFLIERDEAGLVGVDGEAEQRGELADGVFSAFGVGGDEGRDGVEGVEEEVGMNAGFERGEASFGEEFVGAFLLHLLCAECEAGGLKAVAESFVGGDAETHEECDDEADGQRGADFAHVEAGRNDADETNDGCAEEGSGGCGEAEERPKK